MIIRPLLSNEYLEAMELKVSCWDEELAGLAPNRLNVNEQLKFALSWMNSAKEHNDIRIMLGAFDNHHFMGFVGASIADEDVLKNAVELNYLFVKEEYRGQGLSLKLIQEIINIFREKEFEYMIVYNHHFAPSNDYYKKLGGEVIQQVEQGADKLKIDIFSFNLEILNNKLLR